MAQTFSQQMLRSTICCAARKRSTSICILDLGLDTALCRYSDICNLLANLLMPQIRRLSRTLYYVMFTFFVYIFCHAFCHVTNKRIWWWWWWWWWWCTDADIHQVKVVMQRELFCKLRTFVGKSSVLRRTFLTSLCSDVIRLYALITDS